MVPVLFSNGLPTEKLTNKYGSSIKDIDFYSRDAWYEFRPRYRLFRISAEVPTVPISVEVLTVSNLAGVLTVGNFGRGTDCYQFR